MRHSALVALTIASACRAGTTPTEGKAPADRENRTEREAPIERYAVGTHLRGSTHGPTECTYDAAPDIIEGPFVAKPGTFTRSCGEQKTTIVAEYADHLALTFPKTVNIGSKINFSFELRDAKDQVLTATISGVGLTQLAPGCTALTGLDRATDPAFDHFMSATASSIGSCEVSISIELLAASGSATLHAAQQVTVTQ